MISYDKLWETMRKKGVTQYRLIKEYNVSPGQIGRLKKNVHCSTRILEKLCNVLECNIEDIVEFKP